MKRTGLHVRGNALLMTLMPSLMRVSGHTHSAQGAAMSVMDMQAMHAVQGHSGMHADTGMATAPHGHGPGMGQEDDCAYCPLLASLALLVLVLLVLPLQRAPKWVPAVRMLAPRVPVRHPCGLGSRGPPLAA